MLSLSALFSLFACAPTDLFVDVPCVPNQSSPYADGVPYLGIHAEPGNSDVVACETAEVFAERWRALDGLGLTQPNTFSPDGQTLYATTSNPEPDGCRVHALDAETGAVRWCRSYTPTVSQGAVEVDAAGDLYFAVEGGVVSLTAAGADRWATSTSSPDGEVDAPWGVHFTPDGHVVTVTRAGVVYLLDRRDGAVLDALSIPEIWGFVAPAAIDLGFDVTALLPESVQADVAAIFGAADPDTSDASVGGFMGAGGFCDNTVAVSPEGHIYVIGGGPDEDHGAMVQVLVGGSPDAPRLSPGWHTPTRGGSATSPSISPGGRYVVVSDGSGAETLLYPAGAEADVLLIDIRACDANTDADPDSAVCGVAASEPLERGPMMGSPAILADGTVIFYEFGLDFAAATTDRDMVAFGPDGVVWEAALPGDLDWASVITVTDDHLIGTASRVTLSDEAFFALSFPLFTEDVIAVLDRHSGAMIWSAPIPDDSSATVTVGPDGALYVGIAGFLSMLGIDDRPDLGLVRFSPLALAD